MPTLARIFCVAISLTIFGGSAQAGLTICNKADVQHSFAVAYKDGESYLSKGWWNIDSGVCKTVIGGDLTRRYYYYRAIATGRNFNGAEYAFCTVQASFDIIGDENCQSRGYDKSLFRKLDTGKSAKDFTLNLVMADPPAPVGTQAGTYGEPYSDFVVFQECRFRDGANFCAFHGSGAKFFVYDDGRTPQSVIATLRGFLPGTPISVSGDLVGVYDTTAEVVLREVYERGYDRSDAVLEQMQGYWYAVDDPNAQFNILGAERENQYDGALMGTDYLSVQKNCNEYSGAGPYLYAREEETGEGYCYAIDYVDEFRMTLIYLPRGNFLEYRKLN